MHGLPHATDFRLPRSRRTNRVFARPPVLRSLLLCLLWGALLALLTASLSAATPTTRVSVTPSGGDGDAGSSGVAISADGRYVAFQSRASNLVAGDTNGCEDIFLRDLALGLTTRVSIASDGTEADGDSWAVAVSAEGRYVAFSSCATNLVAGDTNDCVDVFVHDCTTGETARVSLATSGAEADDCSFLQAISVEGRYVAFVSCATTLVASDTNEQPDAFLHDRLTGETERVSLSGDGLEADGCTFSAAISADGRYVAFASCATNLVAADSNGLPDVFLRDRVTGQVARLSAAGDTEADGCSGAPALTADGLVVAFESEATNLVSGDTNGVSDVFVYDSETGGVARVSVSDEGVAGDSPSHSPRLSADGRYIAFSSEASNLVGADTNRDQDIFLRDRVAGWTERVSIAADRTQGDGMSYAQAIAADGGYVAFCSISSNLVTGDTNADSDVFRRQRLVADFAAAPASGTAPLVVTFAELSTGGATGWEWDFGDGTTSREGNPSHEYLLGGVYTVGLVVTDGRSCASTSKVGGIVVAPSALVADFSATPTTGTTPLGVSFTDASTHSPTSWSWDFGDGGTSADQHPSHTYLNAGRYTVTLTVGSETGDDAETKADYITVTVPPPVADFSATPTTGTTPLGVSFTDLSAGDPTAWLWDFGDGGTSTDQHPTHAYSSVGLHAVTLTVSNGGGEDEETKTRYVTISFLDTPIAPVDPADHWALNQILACVEAGIVGGYSDGTYRPTLPVTRDMMAVFISRALAGGDSSVPTGPPTATFTDVPTTHWACRYVEYVVNQGIVGGYSNGTYRPTGTVTRDMMAVFVARAMCGGDASVPTGSATAFFTDVPTTHWAFRYVEYIHGEGVTGGFGDGTYRPLLVVDRASMAVYVQRAFALPM